MTASPERASVDGPAPDDSDVGEELRHEVESLGGGAGDKERDDPAFEKDDGAMDVPPPG